MTSTRDVTFSMCQTCRVGAPAHSVHTDSTQTHLINIPDKTKPRSSDIPPLSQDKFMPLSSEWD